MKKLIPVIALLLLTTACGNWLTELDSILAAAAPALINILQIAALAEGKTVDAALETKINGDAALLKTELANYNSAVASAQPSICPQVQAALNTYEADLPAVLAAAQVSNQNTASKIESLSALIVGVFGTIEPLIPGCQLPVNAAAKSRFRSQPTDLKTFKSSYNGVLTSPVGIPAVDAATPKMRLPEHSRAMRYLTFGIAK